jgi:hypothetical protein
MRASQLGGGDSFAFPLPTVASIASRLPASSSRAGHEPAPCEQRAIPSRNHRLICFPVASHGACDKSVNGAGLLSPDALSLRITDQRQCARIFVFSTRILYCLPLNTYLAVLPRHFEKRITKFQISLARFIKLKQNVSEQYRSFQGAYLCIAKGEKM